MNLNLCSLLLIIVFVSKSLGNTRYDDYEFLLERCCDLGTTRAKQLPIAGCVFANSSYDKLTTDSQWRRQCELVVEICCIREHRTRNCEEGKALAKKDHKCSAKHLAIVSEVANESVQDCCLSCKLGLKAGKDGFPCTFNAHGTFGLGNPYEEVYYECCSQQKVDKISSRDNTAIHNSRRSEVAISICDTSSAPCDHNCYDPGADIGPVRCSCFKGYQLENDGRKCVDIDECEEKTHSCDLRTEDCINTIGGYECSLRREIPEERSTDQVCPPGYKWNYRERRCGDIDECYERSDNCNRGTHVCKNLLGSFTCIMIGNTCPPGFRKGSNGDKDCVDIDECAENQYNCAEPIEKCINSVGGYYCEQVVELEAETTTRSLVLDPTKCQQGFRFSKLTYQCEDIDECRIGQHSCNLATHNCVNTEGAYNCLPMISSNLEEDNCRPGFKRNRWSRDCEDINECETEYKPCRRDQSCRNTIGSYVCYCQAGYIKDTVTGECKDVNECQMGTHSCHQSLRCDNTIGSYHCVRVQDCGTGYTINAETDTCEDIDECNLNIHNCGQDFQCRNIEGSFKCERTRCPPNYHLLSDGTCQTNDCGAGKFFNLTYARCMDINECLNNPCSANEKCINTVGSFRCTHYCSPGYQLNKYGNSCEDIDECVLGTHMCTGMQICRNRPGNYICECPLGYIMNQNRDCEDIDECTRYGSSVCSPDTSDCVNTLGSYRCQCKSGFEGDGSGRFCKDIDECNGYHTCSHKCFNTWGSYQCTCETGYKLSDDKRTCVDVDECQEFKEKKVSDNYYLCISTCHNIPGSFRCSCPNGYNLGQDNRTCHDINECDTQCKGEDQICLNIRGSYRCNGIVCPAGYERDKTHKSRCKKSYGTASCDGRSCLSEDLSEPLAYSYNYLTFTSNMTIPATGYLDLFTMRGPVLSVTTVQFEFKLNSAKVGRYGVSPATDDNFHLRRVAFNEAMVSLVKPIEGPQDIELELEVKLYHGNYYGGSSKAILYIYVSEYTF